ncbi:hypothetical protein HYG81_14965 [Natrinema zhouii]|uniref:Uncharacterized protein n=1 Tax=Natrinema zhouii TaxID=1710539 RepID=A0A7D6CNV9_9EURY|nr:hypothetical protein [Natrinema zhouii]QLK25374.1 hypothetical protein HYG81_14965 [Natrinema zhouii]
MPSNQDVRDAEPLIGYIVGALIAIGFFSGIILGNWAIWTVWIPLAITAIVIYLFYRLVLAVEYLAYDS